MDGLILVLRVFKPAAKLIPGANEYLDSIFTLLETLCTLAKDVEEVDEDIKMLIERETRLSTLIFDKFRTVSDEEVQRLPALLANFQEALSDTHRLLQRQCKERASTSPRMGRFFRVVRRAVRVQSDKVLVQQLNRRIDNVAEAFQIESSIERLLNDERLHSTMEELESWIRERLKVLDTVELERLVTALDPVRGASAFAESAPRPCLEGTCAAILDDLVQWALYDTLVPVFWLSGPAGTGKSTIARTLCDIIHSRIRPTELQKHLITFFVARDAVHRRNPIRILHTLLHGFAHAVPAYRTWLLNTLADEPDILARPVKVQASVLFSGFFDEFETEESGLAFIVVVDGLDECERINGIEGGDFLSALLSMVQSSRAPIRLLVASRRSEGVTRIMTSLPFLSIRAHTIDLPHAEGDVRHYLTHEFSRIARCRDLQSWPHPADLEAVVASAGGLFIYATTVVRFVDDSIFNPVLRLHALLDPEFVSTASAPSAEYFMLDDMYTRILHAAIPSEYSDRQVRAAATVFRRVVATLVLVQDHISVATLATLLNTDYRAVSQIVRNLSAVLLLENADIVRVYHPSFTDFLLDPLAAATRYSVSPLRTARQSPGITLQFSKAASAS
ncbi:hypothetical protein EXIGLDRAFT_759395 [Exidia glandulosa HHB12029]|uniref:Nephrocystin 3-like N-terminal domain-containing protein n=1 Tax=Exidia glandulosa HHB12029 TaxID=1314781 RepID=A0A165Q4Z6_EXIGL|nr:hypothetical protein EXIGLDRAFT_759395 [Exidia glandulosa HHB12029]